MSTNTKHSLSPKPKPKFMWTHNGIYNMVMSKIWRAMKCPIHPENTVFYMLYEADLMDNYLNNNGKITKKLLTSLRNIESAFGIKIVAGYTFDDIVSVAEWQLEKQGRLAPDVPDIEAIKRQQTEQHHNSTGAYSK